MDFRRCGNAASLGRMFQRLGRETGRALLQSQRPDSMIRVGMIKEIDTNLDAPEREIARFAQCRESGANFILWTDKAPFQVRPWKGKANCKDVLPCCDGIDRIRLCDWCAKFAIRAETSWVLYLFCEAPKTSVLWTRFGRC